MLRPLKPPARYLLGPGPSPVEPSVLAAMARPVIGHLDPEFGAVMDDVSNGLRAVFRTENALTFPVSGTGSAGMEAALVNLLEAGDVAVVGVNGVFGARLAEIGRRCGARVVEVEAPWGEPIPTEELADAARRERPRLVAVVHAETSTGVRQPVEELRPALGPDPLLVVDAVTSLAGIPLEVDGWGIDVCYSGTQKCLSVPPGLAPITFSERAAERATTRSVPVQSWYLDATLLDRYWSEGEGRRRYHHTAPVSAIYGLHEGLRLVLREGLEARWARHAEVGSFLHDSLEQLGFQLFAAPGYRLPQLTAARLPEGVPDELRAVLLNDFDIEIGGGLGDTAGKVWRIGLMGFGARREHALRLLQALRALFATPGGPARVTRP